MKHWLINCDDFGMCPTINRATLALLAQGVVQGCSLMPVGNFFSEAVAGLRALGGRRVSVHLALQGEYDRLKVRPVLGAADVPSLVDAHGFLRTSGPPPDVTQALHELRAQIEKVRGAGLEVTRLDGHMFFYDEGEWGSELKAGVAALAEELGVSWRRRTEVDFIWEGYETLAARFEFYDRLLATGEEGYREIVIHPADNAEEMARFSGAGVRRLADYAYFSQPDLRRRLDSAGVRAVDSLEYAAGRAKAKKF